MFGNTDLFQFTRKPAPFTLFQLSTQMQIKSRESNMHMTSTGCYAAWADGKLAQSWLPARQKNECLGIINLEKSKSHSQSGYDAATT